MNEQPDRRADGEPPRRVTRTTWFFVVLATASAAGLTLRDGGAKLLDALTDASVLLLSIVPVIGMALLLGGYVNALLPHDQVAHRLGPDSGLHGYGIALLGGIVTPAKPWPCAAPPVHHAPARLRVGCGQPLPDGRTESICRSAGRPRPRLG